MVKPHVDECLNFVFFDDAEHFHGIPVNCKGVIPGCQESPFVKYMEYSPSRQFVAHRRLSEMADEPGFLPFGLYGNPTNWTGRDGTGTPALSTYLKQLPRIMDEHRNLRVLLDYSFEAGLGNYFFDGMMEFVHSLNIDPSRVVVLVSNHGIESRYRYYLKTTNHVGPSFAIIGDDFWLMFSGLEYRRKHWSDVTDRIVSAADAERLNTTIRAKKFLSLNRRPRWHRFLLSCMIEALGLRGQGIISMPSQGYSGDWTPEDQYLDTVGAQMTSRSWDKLMDAKSKVFPTLPWVIDIEMGRNSGQPEQFLFETQARDLFLNTYLQVVTETAMEGEQDDVFITEKTCKAIANLQPFLVFGHAGHLGRLVNHGFVRLELFDDAYDTAESLGERLEKLFVTMARLEAWSMADLHELYNAELPRLRFNQHRLLEYPAAFGKAMLARLTEALRV